MPNKSETVAVRVTEQKRSEIREWSEKHGMTEADTVRHAVNRLIYDQKRIDEIYEDDSLQAQLEAIENDIADLSIPWWRRIFQRGLRRDRENDRQE